MFYLSIFLLFLFASAGAMELAEQKGSKNYVSLKALVRLEGYHAAKARGDELAISRDRLKLIQACNEKLPKELCNKVALFVKQDMYVNKLVYKMHRRDQKLLGGYQDYFFLKDCIENVQSLCIDEENNTLFIAAQVNLHVVDLTTKQQKKEISCQPHGQGMVREMLLSLDKEEAVVTVQKRVENVLTFFKSMKFDSTSYDLIKEVDSNDFILEQSEKEVHFNRLSFKGKPKDGVIVIEDSELHNLMSIDLSKKYPKLDFAIDSRNGTLYVGTYEGVDAFSPLFDYFDAISSLANEKDDTEKSELLVSGLAAYGEVWKSEQPDMIKRSGDGCTIL